MSPTKERNELKSGTDETSCDRKERFLGTLSPDPWDFSLLMPIPVDELWLGASSIPAPAWSWPRSRRSGCLPAEPHPPLRPVVVYSQNWSHAMGETKTGLDNGSAFRHDPLPASAILVGQVGNLRRIGNPPPARACGWPGSAGWQPARRIPSCPTDLLDLCEPQ